MTVFGPKLHVMKSTSRPGTTVLGRHRSLLAQTLDLGRVHVKEQGHKIRA